MLLRQLDRIPLSFDMRFISDADTEWIRRIALAPIQTQSLIELPDLPHAIVVAPPYGVVDVTVKNQPYPPGIGALVPEFVLADQFEHSTWTPDDLANPVLQMAVRAMGLPFGDYLKSTQPQMLEVMSALPARLVLAGNVELKYVPVAIGSFVEQLEELTGYKPGGRAAIDIFQTDVLPKL